VSAKIPFALLGKLPQSASLTAPSKRGSQKAHKAKTSFRKGGGRRSLSEVFLRKAKKFKQFASCCKGKHPPPAGDTLFTKEGKVEDKSKIAYRFLFKVFLNYFLISSKPAQQ